MPRRVNLAVLLGLITVGVLSFGLTAGAQTDEGASNTEADVQAAQEELASIRMKAGTADAAHANAVFQLGELNDEISTTTGDLALAEDRLSEAQERLSSQASQMYKSGNVAFVDVLVGAEDFSEFTNRLELWARLLAREQAEFQELQAARDAVEAQLNERQAQLDERAAAVSGAEAQKEQAEAQEAASQEFLDSLSEELRAELEAEEARKAEEARAIAEQAQKDLAEQQAAIQEAAIPLSSQLSAEQTTQELEAAREAAAEAQRQAALAMEQQKAEQEAEEQAAEQAAAAQQARQELDRARTLNAAEQEAAKIAAAEAEQQARKAAEEAAAAQKVREAAEQAAAQQREAAQKALAEQDAAAQKALAEQAAAAQKNNPATGAPKTDPAKPASGAPKTQSAPAPAPAPTSSASGSAIIQEALTYMGTPYVLEGPCARDVAVDCSCFTMLVFQQFGISLPDSPGGQYGMGTPVSGPPQAGDLVFFNEDGSGITHVGIATGNGTTIHASAYAGYVTETPIDVIPGYVGAVRLI